MSHFWFKNDNMPCFCEFCCSPFKYGILKPYEKRGLDFKDGELVTLAKVKKIIKLILARVEELHKPTSLKTLCVGIIWKKVKSYSSYCLLPIPDRIRNSAFLFDQLGYLHSTGSTGQDQVFVHRDCRELPGILWNHIGNTIVRNTAHPDF